MGDLQHDSDAAHGNEAVAGLVAHALLCTLAGPVTPLSGLIAGVSS